MCHDTIKHEQWNRRAFLKGSSMAVFGLTLGGIPSFVAQAATQTFETPVFKRKKILVTIFQRGAMDGLAAVQPIENHFLKKVRPNLMLSTLSQEEKLVDLNGNFGLSPYLFSLKPYFNANQMAIIHGSGLPIDNRSHFDMQDFTESGTPGMKSTQTGWLNRALAQTDRATMVSPFKAVAMTPTRPRILYGNESSIAVERLEDLRFRESVITDEQLNGIGHEYNAEQNERLRNAGKNGLEAIKLMKHIDLNTQSAQTYPKSNLGHSLRQIAQLIKANVGLEIAFAESTGWDTHSRQPTKSGAFARNAEDLSKSIAAFWEDLGTFQDDVVVMTMTEFGRTTNQNGSLGTDHGRGSCQFILGNNIDGGKIFNNLKTIDEQTCARELPVTTDFRNVCTTVLKNHLNIDATTIFPEFQPESIPLFRG